MWIPLGLAWNRRHWLATALMAVTLLMLVTAIFTPHLFRTGQVASFNAASGEPAEQESKTELAPIYATTTLATSARGVIGGVPGSIPQGKRGGAANSAPTDTDRKIVRTSSMDLTVTSPAEGAEKIRALAERLGGYVESAQISSSQGAPMATLTIRVPAARFEDAKADLRSLAAHVDREKTDAKDVTKQYVDTEARIRNLRAEEGQYLQILHSATKVQDMLDVSEKLSEVRGDIEEAQAEFQALSKQVELVSITVSMHAQAAAASFALNWRPMYQLKSALHDALDGMADYATAMISMILYMPVILLWTGTIALAVFVMVRMIRWGIRFFNIPKPAEKAVS